MVRRRSTVRFRRGSQNLRSSPNRPVASIKITDRHSTVTENIRWQPWLVGLGISDRPTAPPIAIRTSAPALGALQGRSDSPQAARWSGYPAWSARPDWMRPPVTATTCCTRSVNGPHHPESPVPMTPLRRNPGSRPAVLAGLAAPALSRWCARVVARGCSRRGWPELWPHVRRRRSSLGGPDPVKSLTPEPIFRAAKWCLEPADQISWLVPGSRERPRRNYRSLIVGALDETGKTSPVRRAGGLPGHRQGEAGAPSGAATPAWHRQQETRPSTTRAELLSLATWLRCRAWPRPAARPPAITHGGHEFKWERCWRSAGAGGVVPGQCALACFRLGVRRG
jgi:hypothetical protein